jgi:hypothetical protein
MVSEGAVWIVGLGAEVKKSKMKSAPPPERSDASAPSLDVASR